MPSLEIVSLSVNKIRTLAPFANLQNLRELYLRRNLIANLNEIKYLTNCENLTVLWLSENPICDNPNYRAVIICILPQLQKLDDIPITDEEREKAEKKLSGNLEEDDDEGNDEEEKDKNGYSNQSQNQNEKKNYAIRSNNKMNEIDSKLDKIKNTKNIIKRPIELNNDLFNSFNSNTKRSNILINITSHKTRPLLTEGNININNKSLEMPHLTSSNSNIQQKMKELKNMEVINIKNEKNDLKINLLPKKEKEIKENINLEMGSSSSATANKEIEKPNVQKLIEEKRVETFRPIKTFEETNTNKNENNNDPNQKNNILPYPNLDDTNNIPPKKIMNKIKSAPIQYTDTNLVLTNFFDNTII